MSRYTTTGLFCLLAAVWGGSFVAARAALPFIPPVALAALRFYFAGVLMLGYAVVTTDRWRPRTPSDGLVIALGGLLFVAAHHALLFAGQQYVTSAVAAVTISLDPVLAAGFSRIFLPDERLSPLGFLGLCLGIVGVGIIAAPNPENLLSSDLIGVVLVFLSAAVFALGAVLTRRYRTDLPVQSMQAWMMLVGAPVLHISVFIIQAEQFAAVQWTPTAILGLGYLSIVAAGVGYLIYFELLDRLGPIEINLVGYVAPIFAAIGGWLFLGETVTLRTVGGFLAIVMGFVLIKRKVLWEERLRLKNMV